MPKVKIPEHVSLPLKAKFVTIDNDPDIAPQDRQKFKDLVLEQMLRRNESIVEVEREEDQP